jgi:signal transduction histidine kinase/ligand-binding sensor domain-containing protein
MRGRRRTFAALRFAALGAVLGGPALGGAAPGHASPRLPLPATRTYTFAADVRAVARDPDGAMWFAARAGLFRYDGLRARALEDVDVPDRPRALLVRGDDLWIGGGGARPLAVRRDEVVTAFVVDPDDPELAVLHLAAGPGASVLLGTTRGLYVWENGRARRPPAFAALPQPVSAALLDAEGRLWVGGPAGLAYARGADAAEVTWVERGAVRALAADETGAVWAVGEFGEGLVRVARDGTRAAPLGREARCFALLADRPAEVLAACDGAVLRFAEGRLADDLPAPPTIDPRLIAIGRDGEGALWIGARESGLWQLDLEPALVTLGKPEGLAHNVVFSVGATPDGARWMVHRNAVSRWAPRADGTAGGIETMPLLPAPRSSLITRDGALLVGDFRAGLHRLAGTRFEAVALPPGRGAEGVRALHEDASGTLWLSLERGGLVERRPDGQVRAHPLPFSERIFAIAEAVGGGLWLGTEGAGLCRLTLQGGPVTCRRAADGLGHDVVSALLPDGDTLWIGTRAGLARLSGESLRAFGAREGLDLGLVGQILPDGADHLWLFTARGIARVDEADVDDVAAGRRATLRPRVFGLAAGMRSEECTAHFTSTAVRAPDGAIWAATLSGVVVFDPARLARVPLPRPRIVEVLVNGRRWRAAELRQDALPVGQGNVQVEYSAPAFSRSHELSFRYRLVGQDADWVEAGARTTASYTNLDPGAYVFEVAVVTPEGERRDELRFRLAPPFHRTWYFLAGCALGALASIAGAFRLHGWVLRARYAAVLEERRRIARDLHDTLEQSFVGIRLQLEAAAGDATDARPAAPHVARAAALVDETMAEVRASIRALRAPGLTGPDLATALSTNVAQMLAGTTIALSSRTEGTPYRLPAEIERHVLRIAQEAVTNALKHARPTRIELAFSFLPEAMSVVVRDDGPGPGPGPGPEGEAPPGRFGLQGMRERATLIGATLSIGKGAAGGTEVALRVPRRAPDAPRARRPDSIGP